MSDAQAWLALQNPAPESTWSDTRLVQKCLVGDERAWSALIAKYKRLVYSIPVKYGAHPEDAADIFQAVWLELFGALPRVRDSAALRGWLVTVTTHLTFHWQLKRRRAEQTLTDFDDQSVPSEPDAPADLIEQLEREQLVREAVAGLPARCREIIRLLFYQQPPLPYQDLAKHLGLARGSIGFIRGRCLRRLHHTLEQMGV
jgi:RNA polymerase sigma factor (sigma-70 family)